MHHSHLKDPSGVYSKVLELISIASGYLCWEDDLIGAYRAIVLYLGAGFGVRRSILLYRLFITFVQVLRAFNKSTPIKEVFSSGLRDLIKLLISIELFQPVSFI